MSERKFIPEFDVSVSSIYPKNKGGRPVKDPEKGPQRPIRVPLGYTKDSPEGRVELSRRIKEGQKRSKLQKHLESRLNCDDSYLQTRRVREGE